MGWISAVVLGEETLREFRRHQCTVLLQKDGQDNYSTKKKKSAKRERRRQLTALCCGFASFSMDRPDYRGFRISECPDYRGSTIYSVIEIFIKG
ncbi:hypothetical protein AVEN_247987-1 [Araneus ventricosus]|uniref:Uncharacterized protein n=1 Tax=Araneus ventricosus TaxID=182803 RepID=A0A4Y2FFV6_ARAVE|nr:hypothetical protein AVEN_68309-1 [Araneus ventricosus]GBM39221.1 hypothetical protein AVEN_247987-1 [Araneus ventricosus]